MNPDDPRLTACALGELDAAGRAEIETLLRDEPALAAEIEATRQFAEALRGRLKSERADSLLPGQRAEVLALAKSVRPRRAEAVLQRIPGWLGMAAGVVVGLGIALLFPVLNSLKERPVLANARPPGPRVGSEVRVTLIAEPAPSAEDLVVLSQWPSGGAVPVAPNPPEAMWAAARIPFSFGDSVLHFDTRLPSIEFSAPPAAENIAPVSTASRHNLSRPARGAKALREARYATAPTPPPSPEWDTRAARDF